MRTRLQHKTIADMWEKLRCTSYKDPAPFTVREARNMLVTITQLTHQLTSTEYELQRVRGAVRECRNILTNFKEGKKNENQKSSFV